MTKIGYAIYLAIVLTALGFAVGLIITTYKEEHQLLNYAQAASIMCTQSASVWCAVASSDSSMSCVMQVKRLKRKD